MSLMNAGTCANCSWLSQRTKTRSNAMAMFFWLPMIILAGMCDVANEAMKPLHIQVDLHSEDQARQ